MALPPEARKRPPMAPRPTGSRSDEASGAVITRPSPTKDTKSNNDLGRANTYKKTNDYKQSVRAGYVSGSPRAKRERVNRAQSVFRPSPEQSVVLHEHASRIARNQELAKSQAQHDVVTDEDIQLARHYLNAAKGDKYDGGLLATAHGIAGIVAKAGAVKVFPALAAAGVVIDQVTGSKTIDTAGKVLSNAGREAVDLPLNAPASSYHFVDLAIKDPKAAGMEIVQPYKDLWKNPAKFAEQNPITTMMMLLPVGTAASKVIGRTGTVTRLGLTDVESTVRGRGILGHTAPRELDSTHFAGDKKFPIGKRSLELKRGEIERRVDENISASFSQGMHPETGFALEFSAKKGGKMKLYLNQAGAQKAAIKASNNTDQYAAYKFGEGEHTNWTIVHQKALNRYEKHAALIGSHLAENIVTDFSKQFRQVVLSTSPKWLTGNTVEATMRALTSRAGLVDWTVGRKLLKTMKEKELAGELPAGTTAAFKARTIAGGHYHLAGTGVTPGEVSAGRAMADIVRGAAKMPVHPGHGMSQMWKGWNHLVFDAVNGRLESQFQTAMMGQALKKNKLIDRGTLALSNKAMEQAVQGLKNTNEQVRLGRAIDRMYGRYGKFSPQEKIVIGGYTPFLRWYMNSVQFLFHVLPADHPILTSVAGSANHASEEWRKLVGQSIASSTPGYLQGGIPGTVVGGQKGSIFRAGRYTPAGIFQSETNIYGSFADTILPQFSSIVQNGLGLDWKGDKLRHGLHIPLAAALVTGIEQQVPFARYAADASGIRLPNMAKNAKIKPTVGARLSGSLPWSVVTPQKTKSSTGGTKPSWKQSKSNKPSWK